MQMERNKTNPAKTAILLLSTIDCFSWKVANINIKNTK